MLTIREAGSADVPVICALLGQLGYPVAEADMPARLERFAADARATVLIARNGDTPAGLATMHIITPLNRAADVAWLTTLVVDQAARGTGVGRALVDAVEQRARAAGCERLSVTTHESRADAQAFYARIGFELTGRRFGRTLAV